MMGHEDKIWSIADHYGLENQMSMLEEECAELIQAISKLRRVGVAEQIGVDYIGARSHVAEEIADVRIMLEQVEYLLQCETLVELWMAHKLARTQRKIKEAQNETA